MSNVLSISRPLDYSIAAMEDRSANRTKLQMQASLRPSGSAGFTVIVKDISLSGFAAEALTGMRPGSRVWLTISGLSPLLSEIEWNDGTMIGCSFANLLNEAVLESVIERYAQHHA
jgi:hypothetical protein